MRSDLGDDKQPPKRVQRLAVRSYGIGKAKALRIHVQDPCAFAIVEGTEDRTCRISP